MKQRILVAAISLFALAVAIQLVPYKVTNPPVVQEPNWDSPRTRELAVRACFDCHSNEVRIPWYGHVAPVSWALRDHVDEGRHDLNFSEMHRRQEEAHEAGEKLEEGDMPPQNYLWLHGDARLSDAEKAQLIAGLNATLGGSRHEDDRRSHHDERGSHHEGEHH